MVPFSSTFAVTDITTPFLSFSFFAISFFSPVSFRNLYAAAVSYCSLAPNIIRPASMPWMVGGGDLG
jgi:hypothetical protein